MAFLFRIRDNCRDQTYTDNAHTTNAMHKYIPIRRSAIDTSGDLRKNSMTLTLPSDYSHEAPWSDYHSKGHEFGRVRLDITTDQSDESQRTKVFQGFMNTITVSSNTISMTFVSPLTPNELTGRRYHRSCPYFLYDPKTCKVDESSYESTHTVTAQTKKANLTITPALTNYKEYINGTVKWDCGEGVVRFWIGAVSSDGTTIELRAPLYDLDIPNGRNSIKILKACDKTLATCHSRFGNAENYGGMPNYGRDNERSADDRSVSDPLDRAITTTSAYVGSLPTSILERNRQGQYVVKLPEGEDVTLNSSQYRRLEKALLEAFALERYV